MAAAKAKISGRKRDQYSEEDSYDSEDDEFVSRTPPNLCCEVGL